MYPIIRCILYKLYPSTKWICSRHYIYNTKCIVSQNVFFTKCTPALNVSIPDVVYTVYNTKCIAS